MLRPPWEFPEVSMVPQVSMASIMAVGPTVWRPTLAIMASIFFFSICNLSIKKFSIYWYERFFCLIFCFFNLVLNRFLNLYLNVFESSF